MTYREELRMRREETEREIEEVKRKAAKKICPAVFKELAYREARIKELEDIARNKKEELYKQSKGLSGPLSLNNQFGCVYGEVTFTDKDYEQVGRQLVGLLGLDRGLSALVPKAALL